MLGREGPQRICFLFFTVGKGSIWTHHVITSSETAEMLQGLMEGLKDESKRQRLRYAAMNKLPDKPAANMVSYCSLRGHG